MSKEHILEEYIESIAGKTYEDRKEAGTAIIAMCKEMKIANAPVPIGEYLGMKMSVQFEPFTRKFSLTLKGNLSHTVDIGSDPNDNITRINNALEGMGKRLEESVTKLSNVEDQLKMAKAEVVKPFEKEAELSAKLERLTELNALLNMDEKGDDAVDVDEDAPKPEQPQEKTPERDEQKPPDRGEVEDSRIISYADSSRPFHDLLEAKKEEAARAVSGNPIPVKNKDQTL